MHRFLFKFYKIENMRFISHLDLGRLFKRAIRKAELSICFSNGYNPHELINIVQPLSLGYESECEYFELNTEDDYSPNWLISVLNEALPEGIKFFDCKEIPPASTNLSNKCEYALYEAVMPLKKTFKTKDIDIFLSQEHINIFKKDKKTKQLIEKDIKDMILSFSADSISDKECKIKMILRCASNETLNPGKLLESFIGFLNLEIGMEYVKIRRIDLLGKNQKGKLIPVYEII